MGYPYEGLDLRKHPEAYSIGRGEQGVFHAEPYKSELLPLWRFKNVESAEESANAIYGRFLDYKAKGDFVGMDVARKYLQMGYTGRGAMRGTKEGTRRSLWRSQIPERAGRLRSSTRSGVRPPRTRSTYCSKKSTGAATRRTVSSAHERP
jgi:hypothetical protein